MKNQSIQKQVEQSLRQAQANKLFKDSKNRVGGSKKEMAAIKKIISLTDLDSVEQDNITARAVVTKDRVFPKMDVAKERENGVSAGAAFLKVKLRQSVAPVPPNHLKARKFYVEFIGRLIQKLNDVKTVEQYLKVLDGFYHEYNDAPPERRFAIRSILGMRFLRRIYDRSIWHPVNSHAKKYETEKDWSWSAHKKSSGSEVSELKVNIYPPLAFVKRVGGIKITDSEITVKTIQDKFRFKEVEFGNCLNDSESRENVKHFLEGISDLGEALNINIAKLNHVGGLSMAFATRGSGRAGAHYEPTRRIINLTKKRGGGTLAHEYGHYIDNILPGMDTPLCDTSLFASTLERNRESDCIENSRVYWAVKNIFDYIYYKKLPGKKNEKAYPRQRSLFYEKSYQMNSRYWVCAEELFARGFETYVADKLKQIKRFNTYLVSGAYFEHEKGIYPVGKERQCLFTLYEALIHAIKREYRIGDYIKV